MRNRWKHDGVGFRLSCIRGREEGVGRVPITVIICTFTLPGCRSDVMSDGFSTTRGRVRVTGWLASRLPQCKHCYPPSQEECWQPRPLVPLHHEHSVGELGLGYRSCPKVLNQLETNTLAYSASLSFLRRLQLADQVLVPQ